MNPYGTMTQDEVDALLHVIDGLGIEYELHDGYSGRGMYGAYSALAVIADVRPTGFIGLELLGMGLKVDNMGLSYVYYTRKSLEPADAMYVILCRVGGPAAPGSELNVRGSVWTGTRAQAEGMVTELRTGLLGKAAIPGGVYYFVVAK